MTDDPYSSVSIKTLWILSLGIWTHGIKHTLSDLYQGISIEDFSPILLVLSITALFSVLSWENWRELATHRYWLQSTSGGIDALLILLFKMTV